ncbi:MAG: ORF6N domain-containing protein [Candidatus Binataceae bacterium]
MTEPAPIVPIERIAIRIYLIRGKKAMLDGDLAELYEVKPIALRQQVKRNIRRFPGDFMFQPTDRETEALLSQNVIPSRRLTHPRNTRSASATRSERICNAGHKGAQAA